MTFTSHELDYLAAMRLGRLATLRPSGVLQNNPVTYFVNPDRSIDIPGRRMGSTRKFANVRSHGQVAFVVDDLVSQRPWQVRCLEIRGHAEALTGIAPRYPYFSHEVIRIHPEWTMSFGINPDPPAHDGT